MAKCHENRKAKERRRRRETATALARYRMINGRPWNCLCGYHVGDKYHCPKCGAPPIWGCPCAKCQEFWDGDEWYDMGDPDDYTEPIGSCEWCGTNLCEDDDPELCEQCVWHADLNAGGEQSGFQPIM